MKCQLKTCQKELSRRQSHFCCREHYWQSDKQIPQIVREKISLALKGREVSSETRKKIGKSNALALKGRHLAQLHKDHIAQNGFFKVMDHSDPIFVEKGRLGRINSHKWREAASSLQKRQKISAKNKGRKFSATARKKMSEIAKNRMKHGFGFPHGISKSEAVFGDKIYEKFGILLKPSIWLDGRCFDYQIPDKKIFIECDGAYWHNRASDEVKNEIAERNGFRLVRFAINNISEVEAVIQEHETFLRRLFE
jgi:Protein of unknown function (DUF559)